MSTRSATIIRQTTYWGVWYEDATGGKAVRELGYEPIEENYR